MKIIIKKKRGFTACQTAVSKDETRKYLSGVHIDSNGTVSATNGHFMVICENAVEPFEGEGVILVTKQLDPAQFNSKDDAIIELENKGTRPEEKIFQGILTTWVKGERRVQEVSTIDAKFPDWKGVMPEINDERQGAKQIAFNPMYIAKVAKVACNGLSLEQANLKIIDNLSPIVIGFGGNEEISDGGIKMILMPIRE